MAEVSDALRWLLDRSHLLPPAELPAVVDEGARRLGAGGAVVYLVDRDQQTLVPLGERDRHRLDVNSTLPGRAYRLLQILTSAPQDQPRLWVPLLDGAERLGVLELICTEEQVDQLREDAHVFASLVAELVTSRNAYTDLYAVARTPREVDLAAELLWRQLPPLTFATDTFVITAALEPWAEVGGDAFDFAVGPETVHLAVLDGMGHGLRATLLSSVALAAYRLRRRSTDDLAEIAAAVDAAISAQFGSDSFVTALFVQLDVRRGVLSMLSAGHPAPLLLRDGRVVGSIDTEPGLPLGLGGRDDVVAELSLQPGDMLLLYTDGVVEARSSDGQFFGLARLADFLAREAASGHPPPEMLRRLVGAILGHQKGELQDDATCLLLEWAGGRERSFDLAATAAGR